MSKWPVTDSPSAFPTSPPGCPIKLPPNFPRLNGETQHVNLLFPDEVSALVLKSLATKVRHKDTDVADTWRCLEIAFAAGATPVDFRGGIKTESAARIRDLFSSRRSPGMTNLAAGLQLPAEAADERFTRIRALVDRILGSA